jgi:hypothetical protein
VFQHLQVPHLRLVSALKLLDLPPRGADALLEERARVLDGTVDSRFELAELFPEPVEELPVTLSPQLRAVLRSEG